jgi:hypothetical protein
MSVAKVTRLYSTVSNKLILKALSTQVPHEVIAWVMRDPIAALRLSPESSYYDPGFVAPSDKLHGRYPPVIQLPRVPLDVVRAVGMPVPPVKVEPGAAHGRPPHATPELVGTLWTAAQAVFAQPAALAALPAHTLDALPSKEPRWLHAAMVGSIQVCTLCCCCRCACRVSRSCVVGAGCISSV